LAEKVTGPLGPRRRIASTLRRLRERSHKTLDEVAHELLISTSKLSRLENAQGKPQARDIRDLTRYYGIEGTALAGKLQRWMADAQRIGWWAEFDDAMLGGMTEHLAYEAEATVERAYTLPFVPALLQTSDYAEAIFRNMEHRPEDEILQLVTDFRVRRQEVLSHRDGLDPLKLVAVTHESTLRQAVGSPKTLHAQLDALIERSWAPNISLHVLPYAAGPVFTMTCMYAYFEYQHTDDLEQDVAQGDLEQDIVHIETHAGFISIDDPGRLAEYRRWHDALLEASLSKHDSRIFIRSIRDGMRNDI
jgi:transcriptional regulator with XRE-family HTH domain